MKPQNFPEQIIWYSLIGTYGFYLIGGVYILGPAIAWILLAYLGKKLWEQDDTTPSSEKIHIPAIIWLWVIGMLVQEVALIMGHLDFNFSTAELLKSSIGWAKGWALLSIFPLISCLSIRPQLLYRGACIVCFQTLLFVPIFVLAYFLHLPGQLYVSPLQMIGGPSPDFFAFNFYELDADNGQPRWKLFTPWAPALGFIGNVYFILALQEKDPKWRWSGIIGSIVMCLISVSRLGMLNLLVISSATWGLTNLSRPISLILLGFLSTVGSILGPSAIETFGIFWDKFNSARASSSSVRDSLKRIAIERLKEAPIWGHGAVEKGPHLVQFMYIGSHSTFYGVLFIKGIVGFFAFVIPLSFSFLNLLIKGQKSAIAKASLSIVLLLISYSFAENLEFLAYVFWPGLVMMGFGFKEQSLKQSIP
ncbi:MAG: O-antigen ligase domain-containing protein [Tatlockia sp.]|nr:O-antigen ligase domain-containing protein [Tatlockia sp.]